MSSGSRSRERDPVIDAHRRSIDLTLLRENLRRTPEERLLQLQSLHDFAAELRRAGDEVRGEDGEQTAEVRHGRP